MKVYLLCDEREEHFSYQLNSYLLSYLSSIGDEKVDDFSKADYILAFNIDDFIYDRMIRDKKMKILAFQSSHDFFSSNRRFVIKESILKIYKKADEILLFSQEGEKFLKDNGIDKKTTILPLSFNKKKRELSDIEKKVFRKNYQYDENAEIVVSFCPFIDKEEFTLYDSLARNIPSKQFIFFGYNDRDQVKKSLQERLISSSNVTYLDYLPSELYESMLFSSSSVFINSSFLSYPTVLADMISMNKKVVSRETVNMKEIMDNPAVEVGHDYKELYDLLKR